MPNTKYTLEQVKEDPSIVLMDNPYVTFDKVMEINHKPHMYMIGTAHVRYASKHYGGILDERTTDVVPCDVPGCRLTYKEHVSKTVIVAKCNDAFDKDNKEHTDIVSKVLSNAATLIEKDTIDGFMVVTPDNNDD